MANRIDFRFGSSIADAAADRGTREGVLRRHGREGKPGPGVDRRILRPAVAPSGDRVFHDKSTFSLHSGMLYELVFAYYLCMQLWLLRPRSDVLERTTHPWEPPFEKVLGLVVRAEDEAAARALAQEKAGNEGLGIYRDLGIPEDETAADVWLDRAWTTCDRLLAEGAADVILVDRREA